MVILDARSAAKRYTRRPPRYVAGIGTQINHFGPSTMSRRVSRVRKYKPDEINDSFHRKLEARARDKLNKPRPFTWQFDLTAGVYEGVKDIVLDAGTGCGKSYCWELATLMHPEDIILVVSPLSALMLDQVRTQERLTWHLF